MTGILGAVTGLFSSPKAPSPPKPPPPTPRISSADASGRAARAGLKRRQGLQSTILSSGVGRPTGGSPATGTGGGVTGTGSGPTGKTLLGQ